VFRLERDALNRAPWNIEQALPYPSRFVEVSGGRMHYVDAGEGPAVVFVHGTPGWCYEFRGLISDLRRQFRCIAADHIGFGLSDRPATWSYSLDDHARNAAALISHARLQRYHLVLHDFGGPIALPLAIAAPERVASITVLNSWFWPLEDVEPKLATQVRWADSVPMKWLYLGFNFSARVMVKLGWGTRHPLTREAHAAYLALYPNRASRIGTWGFARALANARPYFAQYGAGLANLKRIPAQLIWGAADKLVSTAQQRHWQTIFPDATVATLDDVGHFPQEEAPEDVLSALQAFLAAHAD
jgi:haloalkane dehalogenase